MAIMKNLGTLVFMTALAACVETPTEAPLPQAADVARLEGMTVHRFPTRPGFVEAGRRMAVGTPRAGGCEVTLRAQEPAPEYETITEYDPATCRFIVAWGTAPQPRESITLGDAQFYFASDYEEEELDTDPASPSVSYQTVPTLFIGKRATQQITFRDPAGLTIGFNFHSATFAYDGMEVGHSSHISRLAWFVGDPLSKWYKAYHGFEGERLMFGDKVGAVSVFVYAQISNSYFSLGFPFGCSGATSLYWNPNHIGYDRNGVVNFESTFYFASGGCQSALTPDVYRTS